MRLIRAKNSKTGCDYLSPTPCGHCRGCLKDYIQSWSDRCNFESQTQSMPSALVTFTYNDEHLPVDCGVNYDDVRDFNKRFRYYLTRKDSSRRYKFYVSSEYGLEDFRPHYHMMLFGFDPRSSFDMSCLYKAWCKCGEPIGFFEADFLTSGRIKYAMKYVHKELSADMQDDIAKRGLPPLFHTMSKGIGFDWFLKNLDHLIKHRGYVSEGGFVRPLNRYYQDLFKMLDIDVSPYEQIHKIRNRLSDYDPFKVYKFNEYNLAMSNNLRERHMAVLEYLKDNK